MRDTRQFIECDNSATSGGDTTLEVRRLLAYEGAAMDRISIDPLMDYQTQLVTKTCIRWHSTRFFDRHFALDDTGIQ